MLLILLVQTIAVAVAQTVMVTPFGDSSYRLQISPETPLKPPANVTQHLPGALIGQGSGPSYPLGLTDSVTNQNLRVVRTASNIVQFFNVKSQQLLFEIVNVQFVLVLPMHSLPCFPLGTVMKTTKSNGNLKVPNCF